MIYFKTHKSGRCIRFLSTQIKKKKKKKKKKKDTTDEFQFQSNKNIKRRDDIQNKFYFNKAVGLQCNKNVPLIDEITSLDLIPQTQIIFSTLGT